MRDPYVHIRIDGAKVEVRGAPSATLGTPLPEDEHGRRQGVFVEWDWDGERLTVRTDRYGFYPCFYYRRGNEIGLSPSIFRLIAEGAPTGLDYPALAVFLRAGFFLAEDTPFAGIRVLPPNARLEWRRNSFSLEGSIPETKPLDISRDDALTAHADLVRKAVERRPPPPGDLVMPLSGGKDSRHLLLELCRMDHRPTFCFTVNYFRRDAHLDVTIAADLAQALGLEHQAVDQPTSLFRADLRKNVLTNLSSDEHQWIPAMADFLRGRAEVIYDGIGGDVLTGSNPLNEKRLRFLEEGRADAFTVDMFDGWWRAAWSADEALAALLGPDESRKLGREAAVARMVPEVERFIDRPDPLDAFIFWNKTRREIALSPYRLLADVPTILAPYLDHDLYDFLSRLPARMFLDHTFHADSIRRAFPDYVHLPFASEVRGTPAPRREQDVRYARELARYYLLRRPSRWLRNRFLRRRLAACLVSRRYAASTAWFAPYVPYLLQLEAAASGRIGIPLSPWGRGRG